YLFLFDIAIDFETVILPKSCASVFNLCSCSTTPACQRPALAPDSPSSGSGSLLLNKLSSFRPSTTVAPPLRSLQLSRYLLPPPQ
ncbi:hypothetical protein AGABI2DRAFT_194468, partial [Agaricus bisporus var. bisporus H97]|uniref:hypothetical protein n=1 Tax=Agaricus bisporus var. bisporus (strain H97 / ATCC MYA-4626 / FGSC 10389) TaxID=936046 RepID=UPI00029F5F97